MGVNLDVYTAGINIDILDAAARDKRIGGVSVTPQRNGAQLASGATNASGSASLGSIFVDDQNALLIIKKEGYSNLVVKCSCAGMTYVISLAMTSLDGICVVLDWDKKSFDLDLHLIFLSGRIYFDNKEGTDASLDVDDTDSYGSETVTINRRRFDESYIYTVQDYGSKRLPNSNCFFASRAKVFAYIRSSLVRSYSVPTGRRGNV